MELSFLYAIPHTEALDTFFLGLTKLVGSYGQLFLFLGIALLFFKKTRMTGAAVLISYFGVLLFGQVILKHLFLRPRPCQIDQSFALLLPRSESSSFPSTHTAWAFAAATAVALNYRRAGTLVLLLACLIGFSRMYLFMHFPTDVLAAVVMGVCIGFLSVRYARSILKH